MNEQNERDIDLIEAKAREAAYRPLSEVYEEARPRTGKPLLPASVYDGSIGAEAYAPVGVSLVHPTGRKVNRVVFDPANVEKTGGGGEENPDLPAESVADIVASLPEGAFLGEDGKYYVEENEMKNELELSDFRSQGEYERIQREHESKRGRKMDHQVAVIRARLAAGEIDREEAKSLAYALRYDRDVALAKEMARNYRASGHGKENAGWRDFFVDTSGMGLEVMNGRRGELLNAMNAAAKEDPDNPLVRYRNMTIAKRFGFAEREEYVPIEVDNPAANVAGNFSSSSGKRAAAKRAAMAVVDDFHRRSRKVRSGEERITRNDVARFKHALEYLDREDVAGVDAGDYTGLDPLVPRKIGKGMRRRMTGYYTDPQAGDRLTKMLFRYPSTVDDLVSLYSE